MWFKDLHMCVKMAPKAVQRARQTERLGVMADWHTAQLPSHQHKTERNYSTIELDSGRYGLLSWYDYLEPHAERLSYSAGDATSRYHGN